MQKMKQQFVDSWHELKSMKTIAATAMLISVAVVLGFFSVQVTDFIKIGFAFLANELTAFLFGPAVGGVMAGVADIIKYLIRPTGPFFFGFTFNAILGGVIYGMILYKKPVSLMRIFMAKLTVSVVVNAILNTYWLSVLYGSAFMAILPVRLVKEAVMLPIETVLLYMVMKALSRAKIFAALRVK